MTPEEPTPVVAASPESAPAPPPAPEPSPAPVSEPEPTVEATQFDAMASMLSRGESAPSPIAPEPPPVSPGDRPSRPVASPSPAPAQPVPTTVSRKYAGIYETPDALEEAFKRLDGDKQRAEHAAQKLERLLLASLETRAAQQTWAGQPLQDRPAGVPRPVQPPQSWDRQTAIAAIKEESARLGLEDPQADPQRYYHAVTAAILQDPETRGHFVAAALEAMQQRTAQERQVQTLQTAFYTQYPDLQGVRPDLLRQVAVETERRLAQAAPDTYGSPEFVRNWFEETAKEARATFRVSSASGTNGPGTDSVPAPVSASPPKAPSAKPKGAPFAESPSPRPTEPALSGQALHLARVFGRPG